MLEVARRWGPYFLGAFVVLVGLVIQTWMYLHDNRIVAILILCILAFVCLIMTIIALIFDIKMGWRKDHPSHRIDNFGVEINDKRNDNNLSS